MRCNCDNCAIFRRHLIRHFCPNRAKMPPSPQGEGLQSVAANSQFSPLNNDFPVISKHNERESRALWSGLLQYSALNKFAGFNVTSLCACRSDGLGFQRDKPAQWFSPFDNYKKQRIVLFRTFVSTKSVHNHIKGALGD